jgi:hypothetical protein
MKNAWFEMLDPDGFKHSGDGKIRLYKGGFLGNPGKSISKFAKDPIGSIGGLLEDTVKDVSREMGNFQSSVSHELAGLDDAVNENLPGGWLLPVIVVAAWYGVPPEVWTEMTTSLGATEAGIAVGAAEAGAAAGAAGAAGGASASTAFWQATLQGLVDMGVPWELASSLPAAASAAGTSSLISGVQAALTGQDVFKSALTGGVFAFAGGTIANSLINAGVNATIANVASQATVQALRNGKISPESLLISAGTSMMNEKLAGILKGADVPTALIPTALGAVNQALFTGEIDPNKLAAQAVGQFAKGSWDSIKDDLKATQPPAPVEDRVVGSQEYIDAQNEYRQGVTEYSTKAEDLNNDLKAYKDIQTQISDFNKTYQPIVDERDSLIDAHTRIAQEFDTYDERKAKFETPVRSFDGEGSGPAQGLSRQDRGDDTVYIDGQGAEFMIARDGDDTYMKRVDAVFNAPDKDQLYEQAKTLEGKITELGTKAKDLYSTIQPTIETSRDLYKTITQKDATLKELQDNLYVPKDGNLAEKWKTEQEKYANNYNDFLKANEEKQAEDEKKALAEMERLAKEQQEKQTLAELIKQQDAERDLIAKQAEEEKQRQTEQKAVDEMERLKQVEKDRLAAVEEQRKQEELAAIARKNKDDEAQKEAEDKARVAKETADRLAKEKEDAKVIEDARIAKEKEEADVKTKETKPDVVDTLLGTTQTPATEPKKEEPTGSVISVDTDSNTALVVTPTGDVQTVPVDTSTVKEGDTINVDTGAPVETPTVKPEITTELPTPPLFINEPKQLGTPKQVWTGDGYTTIYQQPNGTFRDGNGNEVDEGGAVWEHKVERPKVEPLPTTDTPFGGNNPETSLVDILNPPVETTQPPVETTQPPASTETPEQPKTGDMVGGSIIAGQDELGGTVYYDFENDRYHNEEGSTVSPPEEMSSDTVTQEEIDAINDGTYSTYKGPEITRSDDDALTEEQEWAAKNGVLNPDGTIDWAAYDAESGVGTGGSGSEQTEEEVREQMGKDNFELAYPDGYPSEPGEDWEDPSNCPEGYLWDGNACVKIDDTTTGGGGSGGGGGVKPPTPPVKPPVVPVKPTTPVTPAAPTSGTQSSDITALISALTKTGQQQQNQPVQAPPDPYAHITQMKDIFGTDIMPASSGGSIDDLLRILRS